MQTIVFDENGNIIMTTSRTGYGKVSAIEADVPNGYYIKSVNPETNEPVLEEIPKSDEQRQIDALKEQVDALQAASDEQKRITDVIIGAEESEETV